MDANEARLKVKQAQKELERASACVDMLERECTHKWGEIRYTPIYHKAYTIPGDEPGTMGVDFRGPCYVPSETIKQWSRTCDKCGRTEQTSRTKSKMISGDIAGTFATAQVPDFGDRS